MDHINEHLTTAAINPHYSLAIKAALAIKKKALNRYYNKTDQSEVFRIAMGTFFHYIISLYTITNIYPTEISPPSSSQAEIF